MKKYLAILLLCMTMSVQAATTFPNETLSYVIQYKWGLVQKNAANATLSLSNQGNNYRIKLTAKTLPWADKVFQVRDTLVSTISKTDFHALSYSKITHENGKYRRDDLTYSYVGQHAYGKCLRVKRSSDGTVKKLTNKCSATGATYDMLSIFYYIRTLDFAKMLSTGKVVRSTIFSGSAPETITIKCLNKENVKLPSGKTYSCYKMQFTFTTGGRKNSSAPMTAWISADASHIPVKLVGQLPIGKVQCFLTGVK